VTRILIAEDEPAIALGLEDDLKMEGYELEVADNGLDGARRARESEFDLIVLDIMLPGKDGFEVCRELRRIGRSTPVWMLTAKTQEAEKVMGFELAADDYVTNPSAPMNCACASKRCCDARDPRQRPRRSGLETRRWTLPGARSGTVHR
jgi:DNA-binding response OmpR family regulator